MKLKPQTKVERNQVPKCLLRDVTWRKNFEEVVARQYVSPNFRLKHRNAGTLYSSAGTCKPMKKPREGRNGREMEVEVMGEGEGT
ncbi:hypothetical protein E2C01_042405 [Portunus trituberculatus]|uniref:Uncharacterized protein n=1 Tax=Portunus trituberculatus TaxID=210409 RepID=A0A5B7FTJ7_PORTR|nr:hypothetical protein [Portunus trituberculatus]